MIGIYDRSYRWQSVIRRPLHCVQFHFTRRRLEEMAGCAEGQSAELFQSLPARLSISDPVLKYLALASLALMDAKQNATCAEQVVDAVIGHLARSYCYVRRKSVFDRDRLASWQIERITSLVSVNIEGRVTVDDLASSCSLSPSHFTYLFKCTMGSTPHQWLLNRRIDFAKKLLAETMEPLASIASAAGFSDQSHFTRVFSRLVKASPSAWRRWEQARIKDCARSSELEVVSAAG